MSVPPFYPGTVFIAGSLTPNLYRFNPCNEKIELFQNITPILYDVPGATVNGDLYGQIVCINGLAYDAYAQELYFAFTWWNTLTGEVKSALGKIDASKTMTYITQAGFPNRFAIFGNDIKMDSLGNLFATSEDGRLYHINIDPDDPNYGTITTIFDKRGMEYILTAGISLS